MSLSIVDIDNAKNKRQLMIKHLTDRLDGVSAADIVTILASFMDIDTLEDTFVTVCNVER